MYKNPNHFITLQSSKVVNDHAKYVQQVNLYVTKKVPNSNKMYGTWYGR